MLKESLQSCNARSLLSTETEADIDLILCLVLMVNVSSAEIKSKCFREIVNTGMQHWTFKNKCVFGSKACKTILVGTQNKKESQNVCFYYKNNHKASTLVC